MNLYDPETLRNIAWDWECRAMDMSLTASDRIVAKRQHKWFNEEADRCAKERKE